LSDRLPDRPIEAHRPITQDGRRRRSGRQDHLDILTALCSRIVAAVITELENYIAPEDRAWPGTVSRAEVHVQKILHEKETP
jgi:hypothetical protein